MCVCVCFKVTQFIQQGDLIPDSCEVRCTRRQMSSFTPLLEPERASLNSPPLIFRCSLMGSVRRVCCVCVCGSLEVVGAFRCSQIGEEAGQRQGNELQVRLWSKPTCGHREYEQYAPTQNAQRNVQPQVIHCTCSSTFLQLFVSPYLVCLRCMTTPSGWLSHRWSTEYIFRYISSNLL